MRRFRPLVRAPATTTEENCLTAFSDREVMFLWFKCGDHPSHVKYKGRK